MSWTDNVVMVLVLAVCTPVVSYFAELAVGVPPNTFRAVPYAAMFVIAMLIPTVMYYSWRDDRADKVKGE